MTRVNRPDTLHTELREIRRRLALLESTAARAATPLRAAAEAPAVALSPVRPTDWPATRSVSWEPLLRATVSPGSHRISVEAVADQDTTGAVRVVTGAEGPEWTVEAGRVSESVTVTATEVTVEARRTGGEGAVRVWAFVTGQGASRADQR